MGNVKNVAYFGKEAGKNIFKTSNKAIKKVFGVAAAGVAFGLGMRAFNSTKS